MVLSLLLLHRCALLGCLAALLGPPRAVAAARSAAVLALLLVPAEEQASASTGGMHRSRVELFVTLCLGVSAPATACHAATASKWGGSSLERAAALALHKRQISCGLCLCLLALCCAEGLAPAC